MSEEITKEIKELIIVRLDSIPQNKKISIGKYGDFTKEQLIENVKNSSEVGKKIVEIELEFLRAMKQGVIVQ
jgi:hypothetical protein